MKKVYPAIRTLPWSCNRPFPMLFFCVKARRRENFISLGGDPIMWHPVSSCYFQTYVWRQCRHESVPVTWPVGQSSFLQRVKGQGLLTSITFRKWLNFHNQVRICCQRLGRLASVRTAAWDVGTWCVPTSLILVRCHSTLFTVYLLCHAWPPLSASPLTGFAQVQ